MRIRSVLIVAALVLAACGGGSSGTTQASSDEAAGGSTTSAPAVDVNAAVTAYTECLRGNGIEVDDPAVGEDGNLVPPMPFGDGFAPGGGSGGSLPDSEQPSTPGSTPPGSFPDIDDDTLASIQECTTLLNGTEYESAGGFGGGAGNFGEGFAELSECLAEHGIELEAPDTSVQPDNSGQPGPGGGALGGLDLEDPDVQAAFEECAGDLPNFGSGGPGGPPAQGGG